MMIGYCHFVGIYPLADYALTDFWIHLDFCTSMVLLECLYLQNIDGKYIGTCPKQTATALDRCLLFRGYVHEI